MSKASESERPYITYFAMLPFNTEASLERFLKTLEKLGWIGRVVLADDALRKAYFEKTGREFPPYTAKNLPLHD